MLIIEKFSNLKIRRNNRCRGLISNRNQLSSWAVEDVLISLDDDSCFTNRPDFTVLLERFTLDKYLCGVEFDNIDPPATTGTAVDDGALVQMYTGFGHAIHRARFNKLGGYREFLFHMCEERDFAQRAWKEGYVIRKFRAIQVQHRRTPVARLHDRNVYFLCRNTIIVNLANFGIWRLFWFPFAAISMVTFWSGARGRRLLAAKAIGSAMIELCKNVRDMHPMSYIQFVNYRKLPQR
jgi:GT2 family glycosyltransferase